MLSAVKGQPEVIVTVLEELATFDVVVRGSRIKVGALKLLEKPDLTPDVQFERGARDAEARRGELTKRALKQHSWLYSRLVLYLLSQVRELGGLRELPKYYWILMMAEVRRLLWSVGTELAQSGRLDSAEDIFFLDLPDARQALGGTDFLLIAVVCERRDRYKQEIGRRHIPRLLLSDGTEPEVEQSQSGGTANAEISGVAASSGMVTAKARVIIDPLGARLEPDEKTEATNPPGKLANPTTMRICFPASPFVGT